MPPCTTRRTAAWIERYPRCVPLSLDQGAKPTTVCLALTCPTRQIGHQRGPQSAPPSARSDRAPPSPTDGRSLQRLAVMHPRRQPFDVPLGGPAVHATLLQAVALLHPRSTRSLRRSAVLQLLALSSRAAGRPVGTLPRSANARVQSRSSPRGPQRCKVTPWGAQRAGRRPLSCNRRTSSRLTRLAHRFTRRLGAAPRCPLRCCRSSAPDPAKPQVQPPLAHVYSGNGLHHVRLHAIIGCPPPQCGPEAYLGATR